MTSKATSIAQYLKQVPAAYKPAMEQLHAVIMKNLPKGFEARISYGMIGYVVPHEVYPPGYHADPKLPLPFMAIAAQKNNIAFYHMGIYAMPDLLQWYKDEYAKASKTKLDMGKSCTRFKKPQEIPFDLIGKLVKKVTVKKWIETYEKNIPKSR